MRGGRLSCARGESQDADRSRDLDCHSTRPVRRTFAHCRLLGKGGNDELRTMLAQLPAHENDDSGVCATCTRLDILELTERMNTGILRSAFALWHRVGRLSLRTARPRITRTMGKHTITLRVTQCQTGSTG